MFGLTLVHDSTVGIKALVEREDVSIRKALELEFRRIYARNLPDEVGLRLDDLGNDGDFRVSTNLPRRAGISKIETHMIVGRALLGAAALDQRFLVMGAIESVSTNCQSLP
jgi:hypothetical protein